jgi:predicted anti-sigma-YlaC factor YlaD
MTEHPHNEAQQLLALGEALSDRQRAWLKAHLDHCVVCRGYSETLNEVVGTLRSLPIAADYRLVRATQMRVRFHASRLRETRQRIWLVGLACLGVGLSMSLTAPFLWRIFAWIGQSIGVSTLVWQAAFMFFFITPPLVVALVWLARDVPFAGGRPRQWK